MGLEALAQSLLYFQVKDIDQPCKTSFLCHFCYNYLRIGHLVLYNFYVTVVFAVIFRLNNFYFPAKRLRKNTAPKIRNTKYDEVEVWSKRLWSFFFPNVNKSQCRAQILILMFIPDCNFSIFSLNTLSIWIKTCAWHWQTDRALKNNNIKRT